MIDRTNDAMYNLVYKELNLFAEMYLPTIYSWFVHKEENRQRRRRRPIAWKAFVKFLKDNNNQVANPLASVICKMFWFIDDSLPIYVRSFWDKKRYDRVNDVYSAYFSTDTQSRFYSNQVIYPEIDRVKYWYWDILEWFCINRPIIWDEDIFISYIKQRYADQICLKEKYFNKGTSWKSWDTTETSETRDTWWSSWSTKTKQYKQRTNWESESLHTEWETAEVSD